MIQSNKSKQSIFKIILIGDISTGKTSFLTQIIYSNPQRLPKSTQCISFFTMRLSYPFQTIVQIWDTPGDQKYQFQVLSSLSSFNAVLLFIDITNDHTYNKAKVILDKLIVYKNLDIHFIQTKSSLVTKNPHKRKVSRLQIQQLSKYNGGLIFQYDQKEKLDGIIQKIVSFSEKSKNERNQGQKSNDKKQIKKELFNKNQENKQITKIQPLCQCVAM